MGSAANGFCGIVNTKATETASIRVEEYAFPALAGLGIVFDATTIQETIERFFP